MDPTAELAVRSVPLPPTTFFCGRRPGPWPAHATGFLPKFVSQPSCGDAAGAAADPVPPGRESRSAGTASLAVGQEYAEHPAHRSSASAPSPPESRLHPRSKARIPAWLASARTIARSRWLPCPRAPAFAAQRKTSPPHRCRAPAGAPPLRRFRIHHRNLLQARMKITPYNQHTRLLSFRVLLSMRCQVYSARRGADVVIQSIPLTMAVRLLESGSRSKLHALIRRGYGSGLVNPCAIHPAAQTSPPSAATWSPIGTPSSTIGYRNIFLKLKIITRDSVLSVIPINTITCL